MYKGHLKHHFQDLNDIKVNRITMAKVEKFSSDKQTNNMNLTTIRKLIVTFNQVMNYAVRHKCIDYNPFHDSERPKGQGKTKKQKIRILTAAEIMHYRKLYLIINTGLCLCWQFLAEPGKENF